MTAAYLWARSSRTPPEPLSVLRTLFPIFLVVSLTLLPGCGSGGGGAGNGSIQGVIRSTQAGASFPAPVSGVAVVATRSESPPIQRTAFTDASGTYILVDLPVGTYVLNVQAPGFVPVPDFPGDPAGTIRLFVEPGRVARAPDLRLAPGFASGSGTVIATLVDASTGRGIPGATVTIGAATSSSGPGGIHTLFVPVSPGLDGLPRDERVVVNAPGYLSGTEEPSFITPVAGQTVSVTIRVRPADAAITGRIRTSAFDTLYRSSGVLSQVSISSNTIEPAFLNPIIDGASGEFSVRVPASTASFSRTFDLVFSAQGFFLEVVSGITAPTGGSRRLSSDVVLDPVTVTLTGAVVTSTGGIPTSPADQVALPELGAVTQVIGGQFSFFGAPSGVPLTVLATVQNPLRPAAPVETASTRVTPLDNGSGVFSIGTLVTK